MCLLLAKKISSIDMRVSEKLTALTLAIYADETTRRIHINLVDLTNLTGQTKDKARKNIHLFCGMGLLIREKHNWFRFNSDI